MKLTVVRTLTKITSLLIILFGLPFYFGYGNPLPFTNPEFTLHDNLWLTIFPLVFVGLALGWKYEKGGGYLVTIPLVIGFVASVVLGLGFSVRMVVPFIVGVLYLLVGYRGSTVNK